MKKLSLLLLLSVFIFCGCSDDDDTKTYILSLPNYETHTLDMGDQENPDDSWSVSSEWGTTNYKYNLLTDASGIFEFDCVSSTYGFYSDSFAFRDSTQKDPRYQVLIPVLFSYHFRHPDPAWTVHWKYCKENRSSCCLLEGHHTGQMQIC